MNKLKFFIGLDYNGNPIGVLLSDSVEKANIAWQAMKDTPHSVEEIKPGSFPNSNGLFFILTSKKVNTNNLSKNEEIRIWKRGL